MILDNKLIAACLIAEKTKNGSHPTLQNVLLKDGKAVGTDGYKLIEVDLPSQAQLEDFPDTGNEYLTGDEAILPAEELKKALSDIPKKVTLSVLENAVTAKGRTDDTVKIVSTDLETTRTPELKKADVDYPNYKKILDGVLDRPTAKKVRLNVKFLTEMMQAFAKAEVEFVDIEINESLEPILLTGIIDQNSGRKVTGLIMPVRDR